MISRTKELALSFNRQRSDAGRKGVTYEYRAVFSEYDFL